MTARTIHLTPSQFEAQIAGRLQKVMGASSQVAQIAVARGVFLGSGSIIPVAPPTGEHPGKLRFSVRANPVRPSVKSPPDALGYGVPGRPEFELDVANHQAGTSIYITWPAKARDDRSFRYAGVIFDGRKVKSDGVMGGSLQMPGGMTEFQARAATVVEQQLAGALEEIDRRLAT